MSDIIQPSDEVGYWKKISILLLPVGALVGALVVAMVGYYESQIDEQNTTIELIQTAIVFGDKNKTAANIQLLIELGLLDTSQEYDIEKAKNFVLKNGAAVEDEDYPQ